MRTPSLALALVSRIGLDESEVPVELAAASASGLFPVLPPDGIPAGVGVCCPGTLSRDGIPAGVGVCCWGMTTCDAVAIAYKTMIAKPTPRLIIRYMRPPRTE